MLFKYDWKQAPEKVHKVLTYIEKAWLMPQYPSSPYAATGEILRAALPFGSHLAFLWHAFCSEALNRRNRFGITVS